MPTQATLPHGVSKSAFEVALREYRAIVGDENVIADVEQLAPYARLMVPDETAHHQPCGAISAGSVEDIQKILAVSNKYRIPLWTISAGRNFGYGEAAPATPGQMVLDLKRMNRIIEIDPELGTALVEPGVTFKQIDDYLKEHNLPYWINKPAPAPVVGPVGWTLERGMGYTRYQEQAQNFSGMEVVLADGSVVRTAMGGPKGSKSWQCYRWGYGPWVDGLFLQSNFGIVTKLGLWLMKKPAAHTTWVAGFDNEKAAFKAIDVIRDLRMDGVIDTAMLFHMGYGIALTQKRADFYKGPGAVPDALWEGVAKQINIPLWSASGTLYGSKEQVELNLGVVKAAMEKIGARFQREEEVTGAGVLMLNNMRMLGTDKLSLEDFAIFNYRGAGGAWFAPVIPARSADAEAVYRLMRSVLDKHGFDFFGGYIGGYSGRHFDAASLLLFDRDNPEELAKAKACYNEIVDVAAQAGYAVYRAGTPVMDKVAAQYGEPQRALNRRLKQALDPHHILAPGKSGIA